MKMKFVFVCVGVILSWITLTIIGSLGPPVTVFEEFSFKKCLVSKSDHITTGDMINITTCKYHGMEINEVMIDKLQAISSYDVIYYVSLPVKRFERRMSRSFQYLIGDIDVSLRSQYIQQLIKYNKNYLKYEISIGYRNNDESHWNRFAIGNSSRILECGQNEWGTYNCEHFTLFELWSSHYDHYLINIRIPYLPLTDIFNEFRGISAIKEINLIEIHQHPEFTKWWFIMKCLFFPLSLCVLWFVTNRKNIQHKSLLFLVYCIVFLNIPVEVLTLWFNLPWMTVFNDFRHGLLIAGLFFFWTLFIGHLGNEHESSPKLSHYWIQLLLATITCLFFFIYEFCERGIQVFMPFYSIWGTEFGKFLAYTFITIATTSGILYTMCLISMVVKIGLVMRTRQDDTPVMSAGLYQKTRERFSELWKFVLLTVIVAIISVLGYLLPVEIFLLHWIHGKQLSLYGALLIGNYGLWNTYVLSIAVVYSDIRSIVKLLNKHSQK